MTFKHKLSSRLALIRDSLSVLASVVAFWSCEVPLATPNAPTQQVVQVLVAPESTSLDPTQHMKFVAYGRTTSGDSAAVAVTWTATGGTIASDGMFAADTASGDFMVTGTSATLSLSASSRVRIRPRRVASVSVTPGSASGAVGQPIQLVATLRDANGNALAGRVVTWGSGNTAVATVNGNGMVTGVAAGSVTVTATSEGKNGTAAITVTQTPAAVASVSVAPASASVVAGQTVQLSATPRDASGNALTGRVITWGSGNTASATVNGSGLVTGVAAGSATITATSEGQSGAAAISVTAAPAPVAAVSVSPASTSVTTGQTVQLSATPRDASGNVLTGRVITWGSSNTAVATVNASGVVTGVAAGSATITATSEGKSGTSVVTVTPVAVASVAVSPASASVTAGQTVQLTATPRDASGNALTGRVITWGSSNTASATVNGSGLVTGVAAGSATITATSEGKSGNSTVTVTVPSGAPIDTVFMEGFESGGLSAWQDGVNPSRQQVLTNPALAHSGTRVLAVTYPAGADGGWLTRFFMPGYDSLYVSAYVRLAPNWQGGTKLLALYGSRTDDQWSALGKAGVCPNGTDFFAAMLVRENAATPATRFYTYYPAMAREPDGVTCWGRFGNGSETYLPPLTLSLDAWHHIEFWVKLNTPGQSNASQTFWLDGVLRGSWSGFSFRSSTILRLNSVQLIFSSGGAPQSQQLFMDDILVTTGKP